MSEHSFGKDGFLLTRSDCELKPAVSDNQTEDSARVASFENFHDTMLINGPMPLPVLSEAGNEWLESVS